MWLFLPWTPVPVALVERVDSMSIVESSVIGG